MKQKIKNIFYTIQSFYRTKKVLSIVITSFLFLFITGIVFFFLITGLPNSPEELKATVRGHDRIHLTWIDRGRSDGYNIYRSNEKQGIYEKVGSTSDWHFEDKDLYPETTYYYKATKVLNNKESAYSVVVIATTNAVGPPTELKSGKIGHNYIELIWDGFHGGEGYRIYRTDNPDKPYVEIATTTDTQYFDSGLENNKAYYYVVTQIIDGKESDFSKRLLVATRDWTCGTAVSYDGKFYSTVLIGNQCWFQENLNYKTYQGSWCYNNENKNCERYGRLYNFETAMTGGSEENSRGICPEGWEIPSDDDFKELERALGMTRIEANGLQWRGADLKIGDIMKISSACTNLGENHCGSSRFNIFLGGSRSAAGAFRYLGTHAFFWTSTIFEDGAWRRLFSIENTGVHRDKANLENGFYIRCIKNN